MVYKLKAFTALTGGQRMSVGENGQMGHIGGPHKISRLLTAQ